MKAWQNSILGGAVGATAVVSLIWLVALPQTLKWIESHDGLAGWLQAIFSVAAIGVTGWALIRQERRQEVIGRIDRYTARGDQLESLTAISARLEHLIAEVRFNLTYMMVTYDEHSWWSVAQAFSKIPVHEARDPQIAEAVMTLSYESDFLYRELKAYKAAEDASNATDPGFRMWNSDHQMPIIISMGEAVRAHLLLCARLEAVAAKRREAEHKLATM
jgi:hypothetical protein